MDKTEIRKMCLVRVKVSEELDVLIMTPNYCVVDGGKNYASFCCRQSAKI